MTSHALFSSMQSIFGIHHSTEIAFIKVDNDPVAKLISSSQSLSYVTVAIQKDDFLIIERFFLCLILWLSSFSVTFECPIIFCPFLEPLAFVIWFNRSYTFKNNLYYIIFYLHLTISNVYPLGNIMTQWIHVVPSNTLILCTLCGRLNSCSFFPTISIS